MIEGMVVMEENQNNEKINAEEIKKEAASTAQEVKEAVKNTDIKKDVNATKGFISNLFKNPVQEIETVANSSKNQFLKIAIVVLVIWLVATFIGEVIDIFQSYSYVSSLYTSFGTFLKNSVNNVLSVIKAVITPLLSLVVLSGIVYLMKKDKKKPFIQVATSIVIAKIPVVLAAVVSLLEVFGNQVYRITSPFSVFCSVISTVLLYFTMKALYGEKEDNNFIKKFAIIMGIFYIVRFVISFFGMYI